MGRIVLEGTAFDGAYELDFEQVYSGHELHLIKKLAGLRLGEIQEAVKAGDYDLYVAFAVIALWRAGKVQRDRALEAADVLLEAPAGSIAFEDEDDARPPEQTPTNSSGDSGRQDESSESLSPDSSGAGDDHQETTHERIGLPG